ncbi:phospholipase D-like domain-containing protein [Corallococcus terminator]
MLLKLGAHGLDGVVDRCDHEMRGPYELPPGPEGFSFSLYQSIGVALQAGHRLELLENGSVFDRMQADIRSARESVHMLVYLWRPCDVSDRIVEALVERAREGVACRVVVDPVGSEVVSGDRDFDQKVGRVLSEAGVEVHYYRMLAANAVGRLLGRTHQKLVIIDGRIAYTGGFGIWDAWDGDGLSPEQWRDASVRVEGPCACEMQLSFSRYWQESGGGLLPPSCFPELEQEGRAKACFVESSGKLGITDAERMVRMVIAAARERLWIANAYFSPPDEILKQLEEKCRQGVEIRILGPGPIHDVKFFRASQRSTYERLLEAGVRVYEYQPSMIHAKTMLVDDWLAVVGSSNLDSLSLNKMGEGSLVMNDARFVRELGRCWAKDLTVSREISLEKGGRTNPWRRLARKATQLVGHTR